MTGEFFKVLVTGGRDFRDYPTLRRALDKLAGEIGGLTLFIIHGDCSGADFLAERYADERACFGKSAGPMRNGWMYGLEPDLVLAFPGGDGTADCVRKGENAEVPVQHAR